MAMKHCEPVMSGLALALDRRSQKLISLEPGVAIIRKNIKIIYIFERDELTRNEMIWNKRVFHANMSLHSNREVLGVNGTHCGRRPYWRDENEEEKIE
jgi:hypothetical protein